MPKFKCFNPDCKLYNQDIFFVKTTSIYDKNKGEMIVKEAVCKECGSSLEHILENHSPGSVQISKISMMSKSEKRDMLKKRSNDKSIPDNKRIEERRKAIDNGSIQV